MGLFSDLISTPLRKYVRKYGKSALIGLVVLCVLLVFLEILGRYTNHLVGNLLQNVVQTETNGQYTASFRKVRYYVHTGKFRVAEFSLQPTDRLLKEQDPNDSTAATTIYRIHVPDFYLNPGNLPRLYFKKELRIRDIEFLEPRVQITQYGNRPKNDSTPTAGEKIENLYQVITSSLAVFEINNFELVDGHFHFINHRDTTIEQYELKDISFKIENFLLAENQKDYQANFYYTDNVEITIKSQELLLFDSLHSLSFDRILLSTISKEIVLENFSVTQRLSVSSGAVQSDVPYRLNINLPEIRMEGVDFARMYREQRLAMRSVQVVDPVIKTYVGMPEQRDRRSRLAAKQDEDVRLADYLKKLEVENIRMDNALLDVYLAMADGTYQYSGKITKLHTSDLQVRPGQKDEDLITYGDFIFESDQTRMKIPQLDGSVEWKAIKARADRGPMDIDITGLQTRAAASKPASVRQGPQLLQSAISEISLKGFEVARFIDSDTLRIASLAINQPHFDMLLTGSKSEKKPVHSSAGENPAGKTLLLGKLAVRKGTLALRETGKDGHQNGVRLGNYNVEVRDIQVNRQLVESGYLPFLNHIQCSVRDIEISMPGRQRLLLDDMILDTEGAKLELGNLRVQDEGKGMPTLFQKLQRSATIRSVDISGFDVAQIVRGAPIDIGSIRLSSGGIEYNIGTPHPAGGRTQKKPSFLSTLPRLRIGSLQTGDMFVDLKKDGQPLLSVRSLQLSAGDLQHEPGQTSALLPNITADRARLSASRYVIFLQAPQHTLSGDKFVFDAEDKSIQIENVSMMPDQNGNGGNTYHIAVPQCTIGGIDFQKLYDETAFYCQTISIERPEIRIRVAEPESTSTKTKEPANERTSIVPKPLQAIEIGQLTVREAALYGEKTAPGKKEEAGIGELNLDVHNILLDSTAGKKILYLADSITTNAQYFTYNNTEKKTFVSVNRIEMETGKGYAHMEGAYFSNNTAPPPHTDAFFKADIGALTVERLEVESLLKNKALVARTVTLSRPDIRMQTVHHPKQQKSDTFRGLQYVLDTTVVQRILLDTLLLQGASLSAEIGNERGFQHIGLQSLDISGAAIHIHAMDTLHADARLAGQLDIDLKGLSATGADALNSIRVDEIRASLQQDALHITNLEVQPNVGKYEFGPNKGFQTDWVSIKNPEIRFEQLNFDGLLSGNGLHTERIVLHKPSIVLFRDKRLPFPDDQRRNMPQKDLRNLDFPLHIVELGIEEGFVSYLEHGIKSNAPGEVFFSSLNGTLRNITNIPEALQNDQSMRLEASGLLMGAGLIEANVAFDLADQDDGFVLGASVQPFDLDELNRMLSPNVFIEIASGHNERLLMNVKGNNDYAMGEMDFFYRDLKIALLNKETETPIGVGNALGSFFANTFIIHSNNPRRLSFRKGEIFFERDNRKSIFNFWSKSFLSGVVTSIGAKSNKKNIHEIQIKQQEKYKDQISRKTE